MANKQLHITPPSSFSRYRYQVLYTISLFAFSILFFLFSFSTRHPSTYPYTFPSPNFSFKPETSFVAALEQFLTHKAPRSSSPVRDDTVRMVCEEDVARFDDKVFSKASDRIYRDPYYPVDLPIRIYVYEMPRKFTIDLLWLFRNAYRETGNLTSNGSPVHRLIEQHSIDYWLWADLIAPESERLLKSAVRVEKQEHADFFMYHFSRLSAFSYWRNGNARRFIGKL